MNELVEIAGVVVSRALRAWSRPEVWGSFVALCGLVAVSPRLKGTGSLGDALRAPGFRTDALYVLFYMGGFYSFLVSVPLQRALQAAVARQAPFLRLDLLAGLPAAAQFAVLFVVMDP